MRQTGNPTMPSRDSKQVRGNRAAQLLENAEFKAAFDSRRQSVISSLEQLTLDGSKASKRQAVELVRQLQSAIALKRELTRVVMHGDAEMRRQAEDDAEKPFDPTEIKSNT